MPQKVKRVVFCSGKVYFDLRAARRERGIDDIALVRIAQLYPFPHDEFKARSSATRMRRRSSGARKSPATRARGTASSTTCCATCCRTRSLSYALRPSSSASPAVGYMALHDQQQKAVVDAALTHGV